MKCANCGRVMKVPRNSINRKIPDQLCSKCWNEILESPATEFLTFKDLMETRKQEMKEAFEKAFAQLKDHNRRLMAEIISMKLEALHEKIHEKESKALDGKVDSLEKLNNALQEEIIYGLYSQFITEKRPTLKKEFDTWKQGKTLTFFIGNMEIVGDELNELERLDEIFLFLRFINEKHPTIKEEFEKRSPLLKQEPEDNDKKGADTIK